MKRVQNGGSQPFKKQPVFNNWDVVTAGWYLVCSGRELPRGRVKAFELAGQRLAIYRGRDGRVRALDGFCPHMGADLSNGAVVDDTLECFFHRWRFDGNGSCVDVPCGARAPKGARLQSYATEEKYGFVWIWPESVAHHPVPEYPELEGQEIAYAAGAPIYHPCHHHVCMINGIDAQHLKTVHGLEIQVALRVDEHADGRIVDYTLRGEWSEANIKERTMRRLLGARYGYRMRYADGSVGLLTTMLDARLLGSGPPMPPLRMIFAFTPLAPGRTRVQPIYVAPRGQGAAGLLTRRALLLAQKWGHHFLAGEDGAVYDNIRFQTRHLLPLDKAVAKYVSYVNQLPLSRWSTTHHHPPERQDSACPTEPLAQRAQPLRT